MADSKDQILQRLLSNIDASYDKTVGSFFYDTQKPLAIELEPIFAKIEGLLNNAFARTAIGNYLDLKVAEQGITRKQATYATGRVLITGIPTATVNAGNKVASELLTFTITETKPIPEISYAYFSVKCDSLGSVGNVSVGSIKKFPVTLSNIVSVLNTEALTGGYDTETDDELRQRYFDKVTAPKASGNKYHYEMWAKEVTGVGGVKVIPLANGPGTVKVIIIDSNKQIASQSLIDEVSLHIESNKPIGANVTVESAMLLMLRITFSLTVHENAVYNDVLFKVQRKIENYLKDITFEQDYVSYAKIGSSILSVDGVLDYTNLTINNGTKNIPIAENEIPVYGWWL